MLTQHLPCAPALQPSTHWALTIILWASFYRGGKWGTEKLSDLGQGPLASKWWGRNSNLSCLAPESMLLVIRSWYHDDDKDNSTASIYQPKHFIGIISFICMIIIFTRAGKWGSKMSSHWSKVTSLPRRLRHRAEPKKACNALLSPSLS